MLTRREYVGDSEALLDSYARRSRPALLEPESYWYGTRPMLEQTVRARATSTSRSRQQSQHGRRAGAAAIALQAFGAMSVTVGKYVRYRPTSRVSRASSATAAWAPMKKSGSDDDLVPWLRR